jgi:DNA-binding NarL/FixJ family response regulator
MLGDELLNPKPSNESPLPGDSSSPPVVAQSLASSLSGPPLPPRQLQTLELLLMGLSEKEIAGHLKISRHTVHVYVKALYKRFNVTSKGELLAKWVRK